MMSSSVRLESSDESRSAAMEVVGGLASLEPAHGPLFVVVGVFDGIHRGHLYLLRELRRTAAARGVRPAVITFDAHPDEILQGHAPPLLCDPDERLVRLARAGVAVTVVQHFDQTLRMTPYDAFIRMITEHTTLAGLLMTPDAAFGYERRGTPAALAALGETEGFEVAIVPPFELDGRPVRSSDIREAISYGDLVRARHLLGRAVSVAGDVGRRTRSLSGAEEAELAFRLPVALPPTGRYGVTIELGWSLAASSERRPTNGHCEIVERPKVAGEAIDGRAEVRLTASRGLPEGSRLRVAFRS